MEERYFPIYGLHGIKVVLVRHIKWLEADGSYTNFNMKSGVRYQASGNLKKYYDKLCTLGKFVRTHRKHVINMRYLTEVLKDGHVKLIENILLPLDKSGQLAISKLLSNL